MVNCEYIYSIFCQDEAAHGFEARLREGVPARGARPARRAARFFWPASARARRLGATRPGARRERGRKALRRARGALVPIRVSPTFVAPVQVGGPIGLRHSREAPP